VPPVDLRRLDDDERVLAEQLLAKINAWLASTPEPPSQPHLDSTSSMEEETEGERGDASTRAAADASPAGPPPERLLLGNWAPAPFRKLQEQLLVSGPFETPRPPGFVVLDGATSHALGQQLVLQRAAPEDVARSRRRVKEDVDAEAGAALLLEAMRSCGKPAVGHNLRFDVAMLLQQLGEALPPTWEVCLVCPLLGVCSLLGKCPLTGVGPSIGVDCWFGVDPLLDVSPVRPSDVWTKTHPREVRLVCQLMG